MAGDVIFYGGSFNPPHVAHVLALTLALSLHDVAKIVVAPTFQHPFAKELAPFEDRFAMCVASMGFLPKVEVSRVEAELGGESRTLRTLEHLKRTNPSWSLRLLVGADIMVEAPKWHGFDAITKLAPPIVLGRIGVDFASAGPKLLPAVSSTEVRRLLAERRWTELETLVPRDVLSYVRAHGLYESDT
ncbi:MAG: nicotinate-nicotinamide nucleotide adenylyltransferase [Polyangiaceae bacterium]